MDKSLQKLRAEEPIQSFSLDQLPLKNISPALSEALLKHPQIIALTLNICKLTTLDNFPFLPALLKLQLNDNKISDFSKLATLKSLKHLQICNNNITSFKQLQPLKNLHSNPIESKENYPNCVFEMLPSLQAVDGVNPEGQSILFNSSQDQQQSEQHNSQSQDVSNLIISNSQEQQDSQESESQSEQPTRKPK